MSESDVVNACLRWLKFYGCLADRHNTGAYKTEKGHYVRFGAKGAGDIIGCTPKGRHLEIECKYGANKQSEAQLQRQQEVERRGGLYIVAYSVDDLERHKAEIVA